MAQSTDDPSTSQYDFWVGKWEASWDESEGKVGKGMNHITKILDGKVIQENFEIHEGANAGFKGKSMSVYNPRTKEWKQAWVDNQGGYFDFTGKVEGEKKIFQTALKNLPNGNTIIQRMVFYDISEKRFIWDWESSADEGKTWNLLWKINYTKIN
jgi:hypothetical protein